MKKTLPYLLLILFSTHCFAVDEQIIWNIDNLTTIGGYSVTTYGKPKMISTEHGNVLEFNASAVNAPATGTGDRIQIKGNPLGASASEFTIEMIFMPYATTTDFAPRIFHLCRPDSMSGPRVMTMEIRSTSTWTTDFYIKSVTGSGVMGTTSYPTGRWMHMAMTYKNGVLKGYVNGVADVSYTGNHYSGIPATAEVSLGGRMNNVNYFKGAIRKLVFTPEALEPAQFTFDGTVNVRNPQTGNNELAQNFPNPVVNAAVISFTLSNTEQVNIDLFNSSGQKVQSLVNGLMQQGENSIHFNRGLLPSGIYFYTITTASGFKETRRMEIQ